MTRDELIMAITKNALKLAETHSKGGDPAAFVHLLRVLLTCPDAELLETHEFMKEFL
jgi:hypothetical protein